MAFGMRSKKYLTSKPRKPRIPTAAAGRRKEGFKARRSKYESDDDDSYMEPYGTKTRKSWSNSKESENSLRRQRPSDYERRKDFARGGSGEERRSSGTSRELRGERRQKRGESYDDGRRRDLARDGSGEERRSDGVGHKLRGERRPKWGDSNYESGNSVRRSDGRRTDFTRDGSIEKISRGMVNRRPKRGESYGSKGNGANEDFVEAPDAKLRSKWKRMDKGSRSAGGDDFDAKTSNDKLGVKGSRPYRNVAKGRGKGVDEMGMLEKDTENEDGNDEAVEKKLIKRQRVLDKSGKKIRIAQKHDDGSEAKDASPKKKKRVIKLDPYDFSNKRLDDTVPVPNNDDVAEKDTEISKNAQFRAIQPSSSILSFVEDNLIGRRRLTELKNAGYNIKISAPLDNTPFTTSLERDRIEENVFRNKLEFFAAAKISSSFPPPVIPEIAFAGRSNVGKSSLLNALTRQWGVVRTSDKPGLTQTINFFKLGPKLSLVDLPGYGFAYAKEEVKDAWEELVKEYVSTRVGLQRVCLLIDTKWGMKPRDHELIDLMERSKTPYQVVLTKTDVIFPIEIARRAMQIQENLKKNKSIVKPVIMVSSKSGAGIRSLRTVLAKLSRFVKP